MTYTMRRPTPDERDKITRCRRQFFEVERLGLLKEQAETLLPTRLNDGMPRGSPMPYGIDDKMIRAERTRREYDEAVKLLEVYRDEAQGDRRAAPIASTAGLPTVVLCGWVHDEGVLHWAAYR